ncbi:hypothetical protein BaRGS_00036110 [Batillaria attramentaria]|uniref:Uncharacterized protein n=1 Tax=Batillaria attramentaria TaxID=370345 RepID=A0ABD0JCY2_9CAEN
MQIANLTHATDPANFEALVKAVRELGNFNPSSNEYGKGALAQKLGLSLKKCSLIFKAEAIKTDVDDTQKKCERFEALHTIFNRNRGGEVRRMKCSDFERSKTLNSSTLEEEVLADLTNTEKRLVERLHRVEIRGKFNTAVPILQKCIHRQTLDVVQKAKVASVLFKVNRGVQLTDDVSEDVEDEVTDPDPSEAGKPVAESDEQEDCTVDQEKGEGGSSGSQDMDLAEMNSSQETTHTGAPPHQLAEQKQPRKVQKKKRWTEEEKQEVHRQLTECSVLGKVPQKYECETALAAESVLRNRAGKDVKYFVYNHLKER